MSSRSERRAHTHIISLRRSIGCARPSARADSEGAAGEMRTSPQSAAGIFASMLVLAVTGSGTGRRGAGTGESSTDMVDAVARPSDDTEASVDARESDAAVRPELRESSDARDCTPGAFPCADAPPPSLGGCGWCAQVAVRNGSRRSVCKHVSLRDVGGGDDHRPRTRQHSHRGEPI
jgi:hypothetical protein